MDSLKGLILDTSSNRPFLLWAEEGRPVAHICLEGGAALSRDLGEEIKKFLPSRPQFLAIGTGPGSFTGVRAGVAMAKALAFGWEIPLLGFPSLLSFTPPSEEIPFAILADARMGGLYCQKRGGPPECLPLGVAEAALIGHALFSPDPATIANRAPFLERVQEAEPNWAFLSTLLFAEALQKKASPLGPFPLAYLDGKQ